MDRSPHPLGGALRVAFADFSAAPWQGFEKSECCPNNSSLYSPFCRYATSSPDRGKSLLAGSGRRRCCSNPPGSHPQQLLTAFRAEHSLLVDIPTGWEPRTEQQPTGLIAHPAAQGRAVRILPVAQKKEKPRHNVPGLFLVRPGGFEPLAFRVGAERSIQLSYDRTRADTFISIE